MENFSVRYGESFDFSVETDDLTATTVTFYVGLEGETPLITVPANFVDGVAWISATKDDTKIPLGDYKYQLTVEYDDPTKAHKYPSDEDCEANGLPNFYIKEALDETEVI